MKKKILYLVVPIIALLSSCMQDKKADDKNANAEQQKKAVLAVTEMFNTGNTDSLSVYVSDDMIEHNPDPNIKSTGIQMMKDMIAMNHGAFPDMKVTTLHIVSEGDIVTHHFNMKGTNTGAMGPMPATNKTIDLNGVDIIRFENGKGVEHWGYYEEGKFMTQLGMMPDQAHADSAAKIPAQSN